MKNPYDILGVSKTATDAEIKKAYHKAVLKYHPDKNQGDKAAEEKFKEVNNAFDTLKDPQKRAAYDRFGDSAFGGSTGGARGNPFGGGGGFEFNFGGDGGIDMSEMMEEMLRSAGFGGGRSRRSGSPAQMRGRDLLHQVVIDLKTAFTGKTETVKFQTNTHCEKCAGHGTSDGKPAPACTRCNGSGYVHQRQGFFTTEAPCPDCHGAGRKIKDSCKDCDSGVINKTREIDVKIPAGVMDGARLRLAGMGEAAPFGGISGDLYIDIRIRPDKTFDRDGSDLYTRATIPFATLALGGEIEIDTIDDKKLGVKIPAGTQVGERMKLRGQGMPIGGRAGVRGDLYMEINTEVPRRLSEKEKKALSEFAGIKPKSRGIF
ncbi:MAG: molecular chaperone DnaJ [Alphaproteobacteria bacterium]|nr:molecular chaperone DnaJ [Alphaproteobacteria bacterium]